MLQASKITLDEAVEALRANELGILLLHSDARSIFDIIAEKSTYKDRQGMCGVEHDITYHLFPVSYEANKSASDIVQIRNEAIHNIFARWTALGCNKMHAKSPYNSILFMKYLDDIEFTHADFVLMRVY